MDLPTWSSEHEKEAEKKGIDASLKTIERTRAELGWTHGRTRYCQVKRFYLHIAKGEIVAA